MEIKKEIMAVTGEEYIKLKQDKHGVLLEISIEGGYVAWDMPEEAVAALERFLKE